MINDLLLLSGTDIPFPQAQITIHQPTIKEVSYIGEEALFAGCELLNFSKDKLSNEDKINLENKTDFEILMSIMKDRNLAIQKNKLYLMMVLTLILPGYKVDMNLKQMIFSKENEEPHYIDEKNFEEFRDIISTMFCLRERSKDDYNTVSAKGREIAEKLKKGRVTAAQAKGESQKIALLSRYVSILAVGEQKNFENLLNYTVYQLFDEFTRFELKQNFDIHIQAKMAGAKDLDEVENWMKDIHP